MIKRRRLPRRENFLPTLLLAILAWLGWFYFFYFQAPESNYIIGLFYLFLFIAFFLTISLLLANSRRGFLSALALISFLLLRQFEQGHIINLVLVFAFLIAIELYFWKK
jgi:hypothetical protein